MSVRSPFVDGLYRLTSVDTKARLIEVRQTVHVRLDELKDPDLRLALQLVSDSVDKLLLETSRIAVERLADGLAASHGEAPPPPKLPPRSPTPAEDLTRGRRRHRLLRSRDPHSLRCK